MFPDKGLGKSPALCYEEMIIFISSMTWVALSSKKQTNKQWGKKEGEDLKEAQRVQKEDLGRAGENLDHLPSWG